MVNIKWGVKDAENLTNEERHQDLVLNNLQTIELIVHNVKLIFRYLSLILP